MRNILFTHYPDVNNFIVINTDAPDNVIESLESHMDVDDFIDEIKSLGYKAKQAIKIDKVLDCVNNILDEVEN